MAQSPDPVGIAGTAMGAVGLTMQLLQGCKAGFSLWKETKDLGEEAVDFATRLRFEAEGQLNRWQIGWELDKGAESPLFSNARYHLDRDAALNYINLIYDRLHCLKNLEQDYPALKAAGNLPVTAAGSALRVADLQRPDSVERLGLVQKMEEVQTGSNIGERLNWALENGTRAQERLDEVVKMVNLLFQVFPPPKDDPHAQVALGHVLAPLTSNNFNITASTIASASPLVAGLMYMKHAAGEMDKRSSALAGTKPPTVKPRNLDDRCKAADKRNGRGSGKYSAVGVSDVLIEWKTVDTAKADAVGFGRLYKSAMETRIFNIARLLASHHKPVELRTLDCLGVAVKKGSTATKHDYGLVYKVPSPRYLTLLQILQKNIDKSVDDRVKVAVVISKALMFLHLAGWLHKCIRSDNILFFENEDGVFSCGQPYLTGFEYSRERGENHESEGVTDDLEWNLYRHPEVQGLPEEALDPSAPQSQQTARPRFSAQHDLYSFGIVLLELGLRESIMSIYQQATRDPWFGRHSAASFRQWLLDNKVPQLSQLAFQGYCDATRRCITGDFQIEPGESLEQSFYRQGVHVLLRGLDLSHT
ncbi:hypothetical protein BKA56DRAFT_477938 [Ilyonectria sp. MPI-CAGE-AT-0026]|nr:hypothetical protein BKA56DRAFT_477938 [Ilyonectria sp. MPI-CAGE-AT-0026]